MGYKDTISEVLRDSYGLEDDFFKWDLNILEGKEQIKNLSAQVVKARFRVYQPYRLNDKTLIYVDVTATVWGEVTFNVYGKIQENKKPYLIDFLRFVQSHIKHQLKRELNSFKAQKSA